MRSGEGGPSIAGSRESGVDELPFDVAVESVLRRDFLGTFGASMLFPVEKLNMMMARRAAIYAKRGL